MRPGCVLHAVTNLNLAGAQIAVAELCVQLRARGVDTRLLYSSRGGRGPDRSQALRHYLDAAAVPLYDLPQMLHAVHPAQDLRALQGLRRLLRQLRPQIVHTHMSKAGFIGRLAARLERVPRIVHSARGWSFHQAPPGPRRQAYVVAERLAGRVSDRIVAVSAATAAEGLREGIGERGRYLVIRSGIDTARFIEDSGDRAALRAELGIPADAPLVGTVGEIRPAKAPEDFVAAAQRLLLLRPQAHFVWIGDGEQRAELELRITRCDLGERLHLLGERHDVPQLLRALDVYLLASRFEGLSRTVVEALLSGVPVVTTRVGGHAEVLRDGLDGYLVDRGDVAAMARRVDDALTHNQEMRANLRSHRQALLAEFDHAAVTTAHIELYRQLG